MSYKDITSGKKVGRPTAIRFMESKKTGIKGVEVSFLLYEPTTGTTESLNWFGWINAVPKENETIEETNIRAKKNLERTMDVLVNVLGFNGEDSCNEDGTFTHKDALAWGTDVHLEIAIEEYNGKYNPKIKWVNRIGGFQGLAPETIKSELQKIGFKSAYLAAKQAKDSLTTNEVPF